MEEKIIYLLGAGASANALPLVKDFKNFDGTIKSGMAKSMISLKNTIVKQQFEVEAIKNLAFEIANDLNWLADESSKTFTIDTLAKFYYAHGDRRSKELKRLKRTLSIFFDIKQNVLKCVDNRYLGLLISLVSQSFPRNVNFLTWNYDSQLSNAKYNFELDVPLFNIYPNDLLRADRSLMSHSHLIPEYKVLHLNGVAGLMLDNNNNFKFFDSADTVQDYFAKLYIKRSSIDNSYLYFAWEEDEYNTLLKERADIAHQLSSGTTILVVIGYSFPFFNRHIDNKIFAALKQAKSLRKIYFQDPYLDGQFLRNQFSLDSNIEIHHIKSTEQFYVPFEL